MIVTAGLAGLLGRVWKAVNLHVLLSDATLDDIIDRLLEAKNGRPGKPVQLAENEVRQLCLTAKDLFMSQANLLELEAPIKICGKRLSEQRRGTARAWHTFDPTTPLAGDIHGQYSDLLRLFEYGGFPPEANYLFLGDYVDRGKQSLETICLLLAYKVILFGYTSHTSGVGSGRLSRSS